MMDSQFVRKFKQKLQEGQAVADEYDKRALKET